MSKLPRRDASSRFSNLLRGLVLAGVVSVATAGGVAPAVAASSTTAPTTVATPTTTVAPPSLDAVGRALLARGARAVSVAVWKDGQFVYTGAWGAAKTTSRFQQASISKMLTAIATERLAEKGTVDLDAKVAPKLAASGLKLAPGWSNATVRELMSHTSGAPQAESLFFGKTPASSCKVAALFVLARAPVWTPGTHYNYSNANYCLLGLYLKALTGKSHDALVNELVWGPAGVSGPHLATTGSVWKGDVKHPVTPGRRYLEPLGAAGQWMASPSEVIKAVVSLTDGERATLRTAPAATKGEYGLGLRLLADGAWGHTGTLEASRTCVWVEPDGTVWAVDVAGRTPLNGTALRAKYLPTVQALVRK
jgi:D-alanyl-D-alanine carboxypeptidase